MEEDITKTYIANKEDYKESIELLNKAKKSIYRLNELLENDNEDVSNIINLLNYIKPVNKREYIKFYFLLNDKEEKRLYKSKKDQPLNLDYVLIYEDLEEAQDIALGDNNYYNKYSIISTYKDEYPYYLKDFDFEYSNYKSKKSIDNKDYKNVIDWDTKIHEMINILLKE